MASDSVHAVVGEHADDRRVPLSLHASRERAAAAAAAYRSRERTPTAPYETVAGDPSSYLYDRFDAYTVETWPVEEATAVPSARADRTRDGDGGRSRRLPLALSGVVAVAGLVGLAALVARSGVTPTYGEIGLLSLLLGAVAAGTYAVAFLLTAGARAAVSRIRGQRVPATQRSE